MFRPISILILLTMLAGCNSTSSAPTYSPNDRCAGKPWSWCSGYQAGASLIALGLGPVAVARPALATCHGRPHLDTTGAKSRRS